MLDPSRQSEALRMRALQWTRFAAWEAKVEAARVHSLSADLAWLADAMELAKRLAPQEDAPARLREKVARLASMRAALSSLGRHAS